LILICEKTKKTQTFFIFALELLDEVVDKTVVEIFSTKMGIITSSGLYFKNTLLNSKERYIKSSSTKIEDKDVAFASNLLVGTVGDRSSRGLIDDLENVHSRDGSSIPCGLPLRVIEIGRTVTTELLMGVPR
jgi:hypothetical protein